jgi:hypothetical protein
MGTIRHELSTVRQEITGYWVPSDMKWVQSAMKLQAIGYHPT